MSVWPRSGICARAFVVAMQARPCGKAPSRIVQQLPGGYVMKADQAGASTVVYAACGRRHQPARPFSRKGTS